jgi:ABC-type lipoprotein release transport system permease subunit
VEVTGFFETGRFQYDSEFIILPLHLAQTVYGFKGDIHGITVRTRMQTGLTVSKGNSRRSLALSIR